MVGQWWRSILKLYWQTFSSMELSIHLLLGRVVRSTVTPKKLRLEPKLKTATIPNHPWKFSSVSTLKPVSSSQPNETPLPVHRQGARKRGRFNCCRRTTTLRRSSGGAGWFNPATNSPLTTQWMVHPKRKLQYHKSLRRWKSDSNWVHQKSRMHWRLRKRLRKMHQAMREVILIT